MALISNATVIVEAGDTSGSLHQGWEALRLGRPLLIIDTIVNNRKLKWPNEMIKYGAKVLSIKDVESLLEVLPPIGTEMNINVTLHT